MGLVTNHTGRACDGRSTVDVLRRAPGVTLSALFGPEHGIRGALDQSHVDDGTDAATGLPVFSLYGARTKPAPEQLAHIDTLVFDIADVGCRFYTYSSTLLGTLEAASAHGLRVVVLDRPNPITGLAAEGPLPDPDKLSFTACHFLPVRHGLTMGELARLFHAERELSCPLEVVPCEGWHRGDWYDHTGLLWVNPSPNMRSLAAALLYPGVGLLEFTPVSVGRGTGTPFEVFGAPYVDARAFASCLRAQGVPGVGFVPVEFVPSASVYAGEACGGVQFVVANREEMDSVRLGLTLARVLREMYPAQWQPDKLLTLLANGEAFADVLAGKPFADIAAGWASPLAAWKARRAPFLLYAAP